MKISDFKEWDKPEYMEVVEYIIKNGKGTNCECCHFITDNLIDGRACWSKNKYRNTKKCCTRDFDNKLVESAKEFKKMVEKEKEKKITKKSVIVGTAIAGLSENKKIFDFIQEITKKQIKENDRKIDKYLNCYEEEKKDLKIEIRYPGTFKELLKVRWHDKNSKKKNENFKVLITKIELAKLLLDVSFLYMYYNNYEIKKENLICFGGLDFKIIEEEQMEKFNDKQKENQEPFELKEGMKVKTKDSREYVCNSINNKHIGVERPNKANTNFIHIDSIDWEETRKLNEVKEEPKNELYVIWNPKGNNPKHKHTSLEEAEKEAERLANANPNQEFYVLKVVGKAKGEVNVEWE